MRRLSLLILIILSSDFGIAHASTRIAVAANFQSTLEALISRISVETNAHYQVSSGSSGLFYAQIINGAPFDLFFSADTERPLALLDKNIGHSDSLWIYARGRLALWVPKRTISWNKLFSQFNGKLALANPKFAPYGRAAAEVIQTGLFSHHLQPILGNNVAQTFQFILTGNASAGFVSVAQLLDAGITSEKYWLPDAGLYTDIKQSLLVINDTPGSRTMIDFMKSEAGREIILQHGYLTEQLSSP